jgi:flagellar hook-basal body complex protein FliE
MAINITDAVSAYQKAIGRDSAAGLAAPAPAGRGDFADALRDAAEGATQTLRDAESQSIQAAAGTADLTDVVTAVGKAEITLQTVVTLRDRVIQAYQEILRMPI